MKSLYEQVKDFGVKIDHHESDLYIPVTAQTRALIATYEYRCNVVTFVSQIDKALWYDVPFAYLPFWERKTK